MGGWVGRYVGRVDVGWISGWLVGYIHTYIQNYHMIGNIFQKYPPPLHIHTPKEYLLTDTYNNTVQ